MSCHMARWGALFLPLALFSGATSLAQRTAKESPKTSQQSLETFSGTLWDYDEELRLDRCFHDPRCDSVTLESLVKTVAAKKTDREFQSTYNQSTNAFAKPNTRSFVTANGIFNDKGKGQQALVVYSHHRLPIYFVKFTDKTQQELMFSRVSEYFETGRKDNSNRFYTIDNSGTDLRMSDIADFFSALEKKKMRLNSPETFLRDNLLKAGLIKKEGTRYVSTTNGAVVSAANPNMDTVEHELNHAVYFTEPGYQKAVDALFNNGLTADEKIFALRTMKDLANNGTFYEFKGNGGLLATEFAAHFRYSQGLKEEFLSPRGHSAQELAIVDAISKKLRLLDPQSLFYTPTAGRPAGGANLQGIH